MLFFLNSSILDPRFQSRLGERQKFGCKTEKDLDKAQVHAVGTAAMRKSGQSVLENVLGYDQSYLDKYLDQPLQMSQFLDNS